jgi:MFS family permease
VPDQVVASVQPARYTSNPASGSLPVRQAPRIPLLNLTDTRLLFAQADYRRIWAIGGLTGIARWLEFVALAIFAYQVTHSPELVALLAVLRMAPYVLLGFPMGVLADALDRKRLLVAAFAVMLAAATAMMIVAVSGTATYAAAAAIAMASGAFWTSDMPVRRRLLVDSVGSESAPAALGFDNATQYASRAIGPLIGGTAYQMVGISGIYALISFSYLVCLLIALRVGVRTESSAAGKPGRKSLDVLLSSRQLVLDRRFQVISKRCTAHTMAVCAAALA